MCHEFTVVQRGTEETKDKMDDYDKRCGFYKRLNTVLSTGWAKGCSHTNRPFKFARQGVHKGNVKELKKKKKHLGVLICKWGQVWVRKPFKPTE